MRGVSLGGLRLAGEVPDTLGRLSDLYVLDLGANELTGGFPAELGQLVNLRRMDLRGNRLEGCIPDVLRHVEIHTSLRHCYGSTSEDVADTEGPRSECSNGIVIRGVAGNPGLVKDCVALLRSREALMGSGRPTSTAEGTLNWGSDVSIFEWDGGVRRWLSQPSQGPGPAAERLNRADTC